MSDCERIVGAHRRGALGIGDFIRVPADELTRERLDTGFYSSAYFVVRDNICRQSLKLEPIGNVCEPWQFGAYALYNEIVWASAESGIPYIKAEAIKILSLDEDQ